MSGALAACGSSGSAGSGSTNAYLGSWSNVDGTEALISLGSAFCVDNGAQPTNGAVSLVVSNESSDKVSSKLVNSGSGVSCSFEANPDTSNLLTGTCSAFGGTYTVSGGGLISSSKGDQLELTLRADSASGCQLDVSYDFDKN